MVLSLQPNHPGVSQVVDVMIVVDVVDGPEVVLSSRHPHHPGVLHVSVLVKVEVAVLLMELVVVSDPLLSKNFQLKQSVQLMSGLHGGTSSYLSITS